MKKMNFEQMEEIKGGVDCDKVNSRETAILAFVFGLGTFTGIGALIFGPTTIAIGAAMIYCATPLKNEIVTPSGGSSGNRDSYVGISWAN